MPHPYDPQIERTMRFSNTCFQNCISEWNRLDVSEHSCTTISEFEKRLQLHIRPSKRSIFNIHDLTGIKFLTRLRVEFSNLHEHRFSHNVLCSSPFCSCQTGIEDNDHFLLHCPRFSSHRRDLFDLLSRSIDFDIMCLSTKELTTLLLYDHHNLSTITNRIIIEGTLRFIKSTGCFKTT